MKSIQLWGFLLGTVLLVNCNQNPTPVNHPEEDGLFQHITEGRIATDGGLSRGVAWGDFDADGDPDLYVANSNGQWNALYRNDGNRSFKKITAARDPGSETVIHGGNSQGVNWIDYDNDGDLDLYVLSRGEEANLLFRNDSLMTFTRVFDHPLSKDPISASMACWADMDLDGDVDVFLAGYGQSNVLFKNLGNGQFEEVKNSILIENREGRARACACADANNDGLPELYIANARRPNAYFINLGNWDFQQVEDEHLVQDIGYSYGVSWADYDDDGDLDLFVANFDKENFLYNNDGQGNLSPITQGEIALEKGGASKGHAWGDYDNDGDLDLFIANGTYAPDMRNFLYLNQGDGTFKRDLAGILNVHADTSAGAAHADYDRDGDLDLFIANWGGRDQVNYFYENTNQQGNWLTLRLLGQNSNRFAIGAKVIAYLANGSTKYRWMYPITGYASQNDYELHFGLGEQDKIDSLVVHWPAGDKIKYNDLAINTHCLITEDGNISTIN